MHRAASIPGCPRPLTPALRAGTIIILTMLAIVASLPAPPSNAHPRQRAPLTEPPHLALSAAPAAVAVGDLVTVRITYINLGMPYTSLTWDPPALAAFDPPRTMPCKYHEDASGCREITLRAVAPGTLSIHAGASGEIFDDACSCWRWSSASDNGPAVVTIQGARIFLPALAGL